MAARVHPAPVKPTDVAETSLNGPPDSAGHAGRFLRYSAWSLSPEHNDNGESQLPNEAELAGVSQSHGLLYYFEWLTNRPNIDIDLTYLEHLINKGADVSAQQDTGFTVMHYTAAQWDVSIAELLLSKGAKIDCTDIEGAAPIHIAAYSNHTDMIQYLLDNGADPNCRTNYSQQTPAHYAVRGDSVEALELLINRGAYYTKSCGGKDFRDRTPLQLAAELDRDNVVLFLLSIEEHPAHCTVMDKFGHPVLSTMIITMPQMASLALDQLHKVYPSERLQEYKLHRLESPMRTTKTPFEAVVEAKEYGVLVHPVMRKLIEQKWKYFARWLCLLYFWIDAMFVLVWTTQYAYPPLHSKHSYNFPNDIWRVVLWIIGISLFVVQIAQEVVEYTFSYFRNQRFKRWLRRKIREDITNCSKSPIFSAEKNFLEKSLMQTNHIQARYFKDPWNYVDLMTFVVLIIDIILQIFDIAFHTETLAQWMGRVGAVSIILIWIRLLFYARASKFIGPMVTIIGQLSRNIAQYFLIVSVIVIPYGVAFWVLFGGEQQTRANVTEFSEDLTHPHRVAVMLFRMLIVDDYPYDTLRSIDELTSTILVISFLFLTAVISLNLFIALLSDTFQRVYDNARANAEMQKAQLILSMQDKSNRTMKRKFFNYVKEKCSPLSEYYDDNEGDGGSSAASLTKITHQIYKLVKRFSDSNEADRSELNNVKDAVARLEEHVMTISQSLEEMKSVLSSTESARIVPIKPIYLKGLKKHHEIHSEASQQQRPQWSPLETRDEPSLQMPSQRGMTRRKIVPGPPYLPQLSQPVSVLDDHLAFYQGHRKIRRSSLRTRTVKRNPSVEESDEES